MKEGIYVGGQFQTGVFAQILTGVYDHTISDIFP